MGLFSKLVGNDKDAKKAVDFLKGVVGDAVNEVAKAAEAAKASGGATPQEARAAVPSSQSMEDGRYSSIPAEENQYNFQGTWLQYFDKILHEDWDEYSIRREEGYDDRCPLFVFYSGAKKELVIELKTERSTAQRIKKQCAAEGVRYLRFYYDHEGWWNTRAYVRARISKALNS